LPISACKKKLYALNPKRAPVEVLTQRTSKSQRREKADAPALERKVRQLLADKISGNQVGIWLLIPEHLRLGTWDLLCRWTQAHSSELAPRLALQLVHEAAFCRVNLRSGRTLSQKGFELANGLPFIAGDCPLHHLLKERTVAQTQALQSALGKLRRASGHFQGSLLVLDPHRIHSSTKRQMRRRACKNKHKPSKQLQCFFCLDASTGQPLAFTLASGACTVAQATPALLAMVQEIFALKPQSLSRPLLLADQEHYVHELFEFLAELPFDLLVPMRICKKGQKQPWHELQAEDFQRHWAGYALAIRPRRFGQRQLFELIQRCGERPENYQFHCFLSTRQSAPLEQLSEDFSQRWHIEEFFKFNQALGWQRAGTLNLNVRYGQMTLALIAQSVLHQLRTRLAEPYCSWDALHLSTALLSALEGDIRVKEDTIVVTYYNAPNAEHLRKHYEGLPEKLQAEGVDPRVPWLYDFKLDFRFM
jgi:hypothetical protein